MWNIISGSNNYLSSCGKYIAIYKHGHGGLALYWTFMVTEKKRNQRNAMAIGGLLSKELFNRLKR